MPLPPALPQGAEDAELTPSAPVLAIVGPTASGKTALALELARRLDAELVSADSRQMYKVLDAGTDKPAGRWIDRPQGRVYESSGVAYHLVDVLDPSEPTDAGRFAALAQPLLRAIAERGRLPALVGGTGLYVKAALGALDPMPRRDAAVRERLAAVAELEGAAALHERLARVDPAAAAGIPPNNVQRVVRALEVYELTGRPISSFWSGSAGTPAVYLGVSWPKGELEERIRRRCEATFPAMVEEVRRLVPARYAGTEPGFTSLGYPEALACAQEGLPPAEGLRRFVQTTRQYAKRQATWFRRQAPVRWIAAGAGEPRRWADEAETILREASRSA